MRRRLTLKQYEIYLTDRQADALMAEAESIVYFQDSNLPKGQVSTFSREYRRVIYAHIFEQLRQSGCYGLNAVLHVTYDRKSGDRVPLTYCQHGNLITVHCVDCEETPEG